MNAVPRLQMVFKTWGSRWYVREKKEDCIAFWEGRCRS